MTTVISVTFLALHLVSIKFCSFSILRQFCSRVRYFFIQITHVREKEKKKRNGRNNSNEKAGWMPF
jgi:hypothetical protein